MSTAPLHSVLRVDDPWLEASTRERALALDSWLDGQARGAWADLTRAWRLPPVATTPVRDLWAYHLVVMEAARVETAGRGGSAASAIEALACEPLDECEPVHMPGGGIFSLPCDHRVIRSDLRTVAHPSIAGFVLSGLSRAAIANTARADIVEALSLVASAPPDLLQLVRFHCGAIALLGVEPSLEPGKCVSLTSKLIPGIVYVTPVPPILMAESIVHESAHLCLASHERRVCLYVDSARRVMTPLRPDPRPISGLMHQVWVLWHLTRLYRALLASPSEAVVRIFRPVEKRLALHEEGLAQGIAALGDATDGLTPDGVLLVDALGSAATNR